MKTAQDIVNYIDTKYVFMIERPWMYGGAPRMLEAIIFELELLRDFITEQTTPGKAFTDYIDSLGYGSAASIFNVPGEPSPPVDKAGFAIMASVLTGYLQSQSRLVNEENRSDDREATQLDNHRGEQAPGP